MTTLFLLLLCIKRVKGGIEMANTILQTRKLRLVFLEGTNEKGNPVYAFKTYNTKASSTEDQLYKAANALASLQSLPLERVEQNDVHFIVE